MVEAWAFWGVVVAFLIWVGFAIYWMKKAEKAQQELEQEKLNANKRYIAFYYEDFGSHQVAKKFVDSNDREELTGKAAIWVLGNPDEECCSRRVNVYDRNGGSYPFQKELKLIARYGDKFKNSDVGT